MKKVEITIRTREGDKTVTGYLFRVDGFENDFVVHRQFPDMTEFGLWTDWIVTERSSGFSMWAQNNSNEQITRTKAVERTKLFLSDKSQHYLDKYIDETLKREGLKYIPA